MGHQQRRDPIHWPQALYLGTHIHGAVHWAKHLPTGLCSHVDPLDLRSGTFNSYLDSLIRYEVKLNLKEPFCLTIIPTSK